MPNIIEIPVRQSETFNDLQGYYEGDDIALKLVGTFRRFRIFGWDETGEGRMVVKGPMVPGPIAYMQEMATIIDSTPMPDKMRYIDVRADDLLLIRKDMFRVQIQPGLHGAATLVRIKEEA